MARPKLVALAAALAAGVGAPGAQASHWFPGACGLPTEQPLHVEYAEVGVSPVIRNEIFAAARPPLVLGTSGANVPRELRAGGAHTIYWMMKMERIVGTTRAPADPATVAPATDALFSKAVEQSACRTPVIALNELWGNYLSTPWSPTYAQYRANTLAMLQRLHALGAHPYLFVTTSPRPFTGSVDALAWWQAAAEVSDFVLEIHFDGRFIARQGPIVGSRRRRMRMRRVLARFTDIGIPPQRLGLLHGLQSGLGSGGREGLPLAQWLRVVKWETLAASQIASERAAAGTPLASDWSWGWRSIGDQFDADKPIAACVYLWVRNPALCDGPGRAAAAGVTFNTSLTEGQLLLAPGVQCTVGRRTIATAAVDALAAVKTDAGLPLGRPAALGALFARIVEGRRASAQPAELARAERRIVFARFAGNALDYEAALQARNLTPELARSLIADQIRRRKLVRQLRGDRPARAWSARVRGRLLTTTTCLRDELPSSSAVDLSSRLRFLRLA